MARSILLPNAFIWENVRMVDFMESIEICIHVPRGQKILECLFEVT